MMPWWRMGWMIERWRRGWRPWWPPYGPSRRRLAFVLRDLPRSAWRDPRYARPAGLPRVVGFWEGPYVAPEVAAWHRATARHRLVLGRLVLANRRRYRWPAAAAGRGRIGSTAITTALRRGSCGSVATERPTLARNFCVGESIAFPMPTRLQDGAGGWTPAFRERVAAYKRLNKIPLR